MLHHGYRDKTPASPRDMPFDGDDGDARDGASPSGSSGFIRTRSQQPEHRSHPSTPPGGNLDSGETTIHGRYTLAQKLRAIENLPTELCTYIYMRTCVHLPSRRTGFDAVDRRDRGRIRREAGRRQAKRRRQREGRCSISALHQMVIISIASGTLRR